MSMQNMKHMPTSPVICGQIKAKGTRFVNILKDFWFLSPFLTSLKRKLFWSSTACLNIQTTKCCTCHIVDITCKICASEILSSACKLTIHYFIVMFSGLDRCRTFTRIPCKILSFLSFFFSFLRWRCCGSITQWMRLLNVHTGDDGVRLDFISSNEWKSWKLYFSIADRHFMKWTLKYVCFCKHKRSPKQYVD